MKIDKRAALVLSFGYKEDIIRLNENRGYLDISKETKDFPSNFRVIKKQNEKN